MRGLPDPQCSMLVIVAPEERMPQDHPLWRIVEVANAALGRLLPKFDQLYAPVGRTLFYEVV